MRLPLILVTLLVTAPVHAIELRFKCFGEKTYFSCTATGCQKASRLEGYNVFKFDPDKQSGTLQGCDKDGYCDKNLGKLSQVQKSPEGYYEMIATNMAFTPGVLYRVGSNAYAVADMMGSGISATFGRCTPMP